MAPDQKGHGGGPVVAGERCSRAEAADPGRLADELGRRQMPAADKGQERRRDQDRHRPDLAFERVDRVGQLTDPAEQVAGEASDGLGALRKLRRESIEDDPPVERACRRFGDGQLDEEPAKALLVTGPIDDEVLTMIDQETQLTLGPIQPGAREVWLADGRPGDRQGVDRIALAGSRFDRRVPAISLGGTRKTRSPPARRSRSSRRVRCLQSSSAQVRSRQRRANRTSSRWPAAAVLTVRSASLRPVPSTATTVCVRLCESTPMTTLSAVSLLKG